MTVTREDGYVLLKHYNSNPKIVKIQADGTVYSFSTTNPSGQLRYGNLSMAWVQPNHVGSLLALMAKTCCNKKTHEFQLANDLDLSLWMTGERPK